MLNAQELFVFLQGHNLEHPLKDDWESFVDAINVWADCWLTGGVMEYHHGKVSSMQNLLEVCCDGDKIAKLKCLGDEITIEFWDDELKEFYGDVYPFRFSS